jgi:hypothetical protein
VNNYELIHTEQYKGFDIKFYTTWEYEHPAMLFDESEWDLKELCQKIDDGDYVWFIAKVTASKHGIELADDYLGGCLYDNVQQFVTEDGYYADMRENVVKEAIANIELLTA